MGWEWTRVLRMTIVSGIVSMLITIALANSVTYADSNEREVVIKLEAGNSNVWINGDQIKVQAPYAQAGTTMVPLSVITKAFGAGLKLEQNKVITLTYNYTRLILTLGSKTVKVNGREVAIAVAPTAVNNVTMVPLRVVAEAFDAELDLPKGTKQIVITGKRAIPALVTNDNLMAENRIGDSYYGWTMNEPTSMELVHQSDTGTFLVWNDEKGVTYLVLSIFELTRELTKEEIHGIMEPEPDSGEKVLGIKTIAVNGMKFEKMITHANGKYQEYRTIQHDGHLFIIQLDVPSELQKDLDRYQPLLDSFQPVYNPSNSGIMDITKLPNGMMMKEDRESGLNLRIPVEWQQNSFSAYPMYFGEEGSLSVKVSPLSEADTLDAWASRIRQNLHEDYRADYIQISEPSYRQIDGARAIALKYLYSNDKNEWYVANDVMLVKNGYKFHIQYYYSDANNQESAQLFDLILASIAIDPGAFENNSADEPADRTSKLFRSSEDYGYNIELPAYWNNIFGESAEDHFMYGTVGVTAELQVVGGETKQSIVTGFYEYLQQLHEEESYEYKVVEEKEVTIGGTAAIRMEFELLIKMQGGIPYRWIIYVCERNDDVFILEFQVNEANNTPYHKRLIEAIITSLTFASE